MPPTPTVTLLATTVPESCGKCRRRDGTGWDAMLALSEPFKMQFRTLSCGGGRLDIL